EPLLSPACKTPSGSLRSVINPTCPKHGHAAALAQTAGKMGPQSGSLTAAHGLEEIQV
ncbi:unnamed protein product, partial [Thelazia callipaeda]|uniref:TTLL4 n=1 Tax=Thelazia callipaeda TaxID=103827 RepID=A0A0N5CTS0_THECL